MFTRLRRASALTAAAVALAGAALAAAGTTPAAAVDGSSGSPGFCSDDKGTTVVVDLTKLGGDVIVRCAPGEELTGFEALEAAGLEVERTSGSGMTSVCRIEGRPAADEELALDGKAGYREACTGMPPAEAYWSYWSAENGDEWGFSQKGPQSSQAITGGFEGWSFALNSTPKEPAIPSIDPVRPNGSSGDSGMQNGVEWTGGEQSTDTTSETEDTGSDAAPWVAGGVIAVLAVLIGFTVVRRRARSGTE